MGASDVLILIRKLVRSINIESKRIQKEYGISIPQLLCLSYLRECDNYQATHKDLRDFLHLNASTVSGIVDRLENKGYIARLPKKDDKRVTFVVLTSSGYSLLENDPTLLQDKLSDKLNNLSESKVDEIKLSLELLTRALDIEEIDASPLLTIEEEIVGQ